MKDKNGLCRPLVFTTPIPSWAFYHQKSFFGIFQEFCLYILNGRIQRAESQVGGLHVKSTTQQSDDEEAYLIKDDLIYFNYTKIHCNNLQPFFPRQHYPEIQKEIKKNGQIGGLSDCTKVAPEKAIIS